MSFEQLYRQLFPDLHRYAFTILGDYEWSVDVVQDAFVKYYRQLEGGTAITHNKAYLYKAVYHTAISQLRKKTTGDRHSALAARDEEVQMSAEDQRIEAERSRDMAILINKVLEQLPDQCKQVFLKSRAGGKKYREIAAEMGLSVKTVEAHMSKALKIIQEFIRVNRDKLSLIQIVMLYELFC